MQHSKGLDGIRGMAVFFVMLFHFGFFGAGWIGVQVFFTLSGYLITNILLSDRQKPFKTYLSKFYWHRALRILPVLCLFLLFSAFTFSLLGTPASFQADWLWLATFTANIARLRVQDLGPSFVHIWSLAVEQQFYLLWPIMIFFLRPDKSKLVVAWLLVLAPLLRLALVQWMLHSGFDLLFAAKTVYVLPFTQLDAFAAGAAIPLWNMEKSKNAESWLLLSILVTGSLGAAVLAFNYFHGAGAFVGGLGYQMFLTQHYEYVWGYSCLNVNSMLSILCILQRSKYLRPLGMAPLTFLGKISYGVYVYHVPALLVCEEGLRHLGLSTNGPLRPFIFFAWTAIVVALAHTSYRWFERPILQLKTRWTSRL